MAGGPVRIGLGPLVVRRLRVYSLFYIAYVSFSLEGLLLLTMLGAIAPLGSARSLGQQDVLPFTSTSGARHDRPAGWHLIEGPNDKVRSSLPQR